MSYRRCPCGASTMLAIDGVEWTCERCQENESLRTRLKAAAAKDKAQDATILRMGHELMAAQLLAGLVKPSERCSCHMVRLGARCAATLRGESS